MSDLTRLSRYCGLAVVFVLIFAVGLSLEIKSAPQNSGALERIVFIVMMSLALAFIALTMILAICVRNGRAYLLCSAVSYLLLVVVPLGTVLGLYSLRALKRRSSMSFANGHEWLEAETQPDVLIISIMNYIFGSCSFAYAILLATAVWYIDVTLIIPVLLSSVLFALIIFIIGVSLGALFIGWAIRRGKYTKACKVMSSMTCILIPFGTIVGILTLRILRCCQPNVGGVRSDLRKGFR